MESKIELPLFTVSIIGTAGRDENISNMNKELFHAMVEKTKDTIEEWKLSPKQIQLVSGGAAWSDHIAIVLFLTGDYHSLTLHFPTKWISQPIPKFYDNGKYSWTVNPGRTANQYHSTFSKLTGQNSLQDIELAKQRGAIIVDTYKGFHDRNNSVAKSDYLIAFTWGNGNVPAKGGTLDTWKKSKHKKIHISLHTLIDTKKRKLV